MRAGLAVHCIYWEKDPLRWVLRGVQGRLRVS